MCWWPGLRLPLLPLLLRPGRTPRLSGLGRSGGGGCEEDAAAKEARRKKAAESSMSKLDAERESRHHHEIIAYLMLISLYLLICTLDAASEETAALLRERVDILVRYGEKHPVKMSFINALAILFAALSIHGMPLETIKADRVVRDIVMAFKRPHRQIRSREGADMASIEMSFCTTCKMYGITSSEAILCILRDPEWIPIGAASAPA